MNYIEYTNIILQAINEVPLSPQQFPTARGLQQFSKEVINRTYFEIVAQDVWPWMQQGDDTLGTKELTGERSVVPIDTWTQIPVTNPYKDTIDWSTIYWKDKDGIKSSLTELDWEQYEDSSIAEEGVPRYIVKSADGSSMGLLPFPTDDDKGKLYYRIWSRPSRFNLYTDEVPLPEQDYTVLVDGALHHMWSFRGNVEQAQLAFARYEAGLKRMRKKYKNQLKKVYWI